MLRRKYLIFTDANKNKNEAKFKFHGQYARSQCWFDLGFDWIEVNFSKHETDFYKERFQNHDNTQDKNTFKFFQVPIINSKSVETFKFHNDAPILKYCQKSLNSCFFSGSASDFASIEQIKAVNDISLRTEESLKSTVGNLIDFQMIFKNTKTIRGEMKLHYSLVKYKKKGSYDILTYIS